MASKFKRAGSGNSSADASWSTSSGGTADTTAPTAADDVFLDSNSGDLTIDAAFACRSINCTGYTGTITHNNSVTMSIGDSTAGSGNIALKFVAGMTYTLGGAASNISFVTTSFTQQSIDFAGKTSGAVTFDGANASWIYQGAHTVAAGRTLTYVRGTLNFNGQTCSFGKFDSNNNNIRVFTLGSANITLVDSGTVWNLGTGNLTFSGASSTITASGATVTFNGGSTSTYGTVNLNGSGVTTVGPTTFTNFTKNGTAVKTDVLSLTGNIIITGTTTIAGNSSINRLLIQSSAVGTSRTITSASNVLSNVDFQDITAAGAGSWNLASITGNSGDCGGNTGITFTTAITQIWDGTSGGNWSNNAWSGRVPLPQDNVTISSAFTSSQIIVANMARLGKSIDFTGSTGTPTLNFGSGAVVLYGSLTLISGMSLSGNQNITFAGRGNFTITSSGKTFPSIVNFTNANGLYTLQDDFVSTNTFTHSNGTFNANNFNVTASVFNSNSFLTRTLTMGSGNWTTTSTTGTIWNFSTGSLTLNANTSTIVISGTSSSTRTFAGGGATYNNLNYVLSGSTGQLTVTGGNTFNVFRFSDPSNARTLAFTSLTTTIFLGNPEINGTSGKLMSIVSTSGGSAATLSKSSGVVQMSYVSIQDITATGGATWLAEPTSTSVSGNTGIIFNKPFKMQSVVGNIKTTYYSGCTYDWNLSTTPGGKNRGFNS